MPGGHGGSDIVPFIMSQLGGWAAWRRYVATDTVALAWRFGPPGSPVARGIDILTIRDGRVSVVRTLIAAEIGA